MGEWEPRQVYQEGDRVKIDGEWWEFRDGKFRMMKEDAHPWVVKFYSFLWIMLKVLMIIGFAALVIWWRIRFDAWYVNWLINK